MVRESGNFNSLCVRTPWFPFLLVVLMLLAMSGNKVWAAATVKPDLHFFNEVDLNPRAALGTRVAQLYLTEEIYEQANISYSLAGAKRLRKYFVVQDGVLYTRRALAHRLQEKQVIRLKIVATDNDTKKRNSKILRVHMRANAGRAL